MDCSAPPPLSDDQISAALDGAAEPDMLAHLAACASCAARLAKAHAMEQQLHARLYRWDCPPPERLAALERGRLPADERQALAEHVASCPSCARELQDLRAFLAAADTLPAILAAPARSGPHGARRFAQPVQRQPGLALRGAGAAPLMAEADGVTIFVDAQPASGQRLVLQCQLVAGDLEAWEGALAELRQGGALVASAFVDDLGSFQLAGAPPGPSELRVASAGGPMLVWENLVI